MNLKNPFSQRTRSLYIGVWYCWICGGNGTQNGGLELHHIMGRNSASAFNSALLCHGCHEKMCHNQEEERMLFLITLKFLLEMRYIPTEEDVKFITENEQRLIGDEAVHYLNSYKPK